MTARESGRLGHGRLDARLHALVAHLFLRDGAWALDAIDVAADLVAADRSTPATLDLACQGHNVTLRDVKPLIRRMVLEHGLRLPPDRPTDEQYRGYLLWAFAHEVIDSGTFAVHWYSCCPSWDDATSLEREVVVALQDLDIAPDAQITELAARLRRQITERLPTIPGAADLP